MLNFLRNKIFYTPVVIFFIFSIWWFQIMTLSLENTEHIRQIWAALYQVMAILGSFMGLFFLKRIGIKSFLGKAILAFSIGLFLQSLGQSAYSYFIFYRHIEVPYPSFGDIGFFGSVLMYIYGVCLLTKITGVKLALRFIFNKVQAFLIPTILLILSYISFFGVYEFDQSNILKIFLDFGYPLGQITYVSIAILALLVSKDYLGGMLKKPILFLIFALIFQYFSDFMFLYQANMGTWYVGGINDYLYFSSYFLMTLALIYLGKVFKKIKADNSSTIVDNTIVDTTLKDPIQILNQIILAIIKRQERVAGEIAWEEAKNVAGIKLIDKENNKIIVLDGSKDGLRKVVDGLIFKYKSIFGELAVQVSKDAAVHLLASLSDNEVPESLK